MSSITQSLSFFRPLSISNIDYRWLHTHPANLLHTRPYPGCQCCPVAYTCNGSIPVALSDSSTPWMQSTFLPRIFTTMWTSTPTNRRALKTRKQHTLENVIQNYMDSYRPSCLCCYQKLVALLCMWIYMSYHPFAITLWEVDRTRQLRVTFTHVFPLPVIYNRERHKCNLYVQALPVAISSVNDMCGCAMQVQQQLQGYNNAILKQLLAESGKEWDATHARPREDAIKRIATHIFSFQL